MCLEVTGGDSRLVLSQEPAIVFVSQAGDLAVKAVLLAASLRRQSRSRELVAAISSFGAPDPRQAPLVERAFDSLNVRRVRVDNPVDAAYPIANKIAALGSLGARRGVILLDSDILCLSAIPADLAHAAVSAKPADVRTWPPDRRIWMRLYDAFALPLPDAVMHATVSGEPMLPYYNSGMVATLHAQPLSNLWADTCRRIDRLACIPQTRPWLDQIALPIAIARLGLEATPVNERLNFPLHLRSLPGELPVFCHYHWPRIIRREPALVHFVRSLVEEDRAVAAVILGGSEEWRALVPGPASFAQR